MPQRLAQWLFLLALMPLSGLPAQATVPPVVDGKAMVSLAPMLEKVTPAVVNISSTTHVRQHNAFFNDPVFRHFFGGVPRERVERSLGSGVIVDAAKGYILTNNHVVGGADSIKVTLQDGRSFKATLVGADPDTDIAVLKIPAKHLVQLPLADSADIHVGDFVVAVGNPFGLGQSVTYGIISALGRTGLGNTYQNFIQTDAAINPGNSGGALINLKGQLVGINSMIYSPSGANAGIGFAIPTNLAHQVMHQLLVYGEVRRGDLGLAVQKLTASMAQALGVAQDAGVLVTRVQDGSAAARAGIEPGDLLRSINGKPVRSRQQLHNIEGLLPVGSAVKLAVLHAGKARTVDTHMVGQKLAREAGARLDARLAGAQLQDSGSTHARQSPRGVVIREVQRGSRADRNGLEQGDLIVGVNQRRTPDLKTLKALLGDTPPRQLMLVIVRDGQSYYLLAR